MIWFQSCMKYGPPNCKDDKQKSLLQQPSSSTVDPDREVVAKYFTRGDQDKILNPSHKQEFINQINAIDAAITRYQHHDISDADFVHITSENLQSIANIAAYVFWNDTTNYKLTAKLCNQLYPIYMNIYQNHFRERYEKRETLGLQEMYESIVNDVEIFADQDDELKSQLMTPLKCGYGMAKAMSAKGITGMFQFTPDGVIFPLINLYFDAWQLASINNQESTVFSFLDTGVCGHGTGIRAFIFAFAPQLAKALKKI